MAAVIDTNVLLYAYDGRFPVKQARANAVLRDAVRTGQAWLPHQVLVEFVAASTRRRGSAPPILEPQEARLEAEQWMGLLPVLYPDDSVLRLAIRGAAAYGLSWFDAHLWAYAEHFGADELWSEDFAHDRLYGRVRAVNPFA